MDARSQFVRQTPYYGPRTGGPLDVILLCPHGGGHEQFLGCYPEVARACPASDDVLRTYLAVERDVGSSELAHAIARAIARQPIGVHIEVLDITFPRGILDGNRIPERAIRAVFDHAAHPDLVAALRNEHRFACAVVEDRLAVLGGDGIVVDLHTMAPYSPRTTPGSPTEAAVETPTTLAEYTAAYRDRVRWGTRRAVDVVTTVAGTTTNIADPVLLTNLRSSLTRTSVPFRENDPYPTAEHVLTTSYLRQHRGIAIDVPKDLLAMIPAEDPAFDLAHVPLSRGNMTRIAEPIAGAIANSLVL
ncbi:hypothetical protein HY480_04070 [Candidatus Uhrbacteria bacterium]|nr:hypothetical protein [Candidatus Uhrbacteria bacterium]